MMNKERFSVYTSNMGIDKQQASTKNEKQENKARMVQKIKEMQNELIEVQKTMQAKDLAFENYRQIME